MSTTKSIVSEIKEGYKHTKLGWIPEDWEEVTFADIADKKVRWSITGGPFGSDLKSDDFTKSGVRILQLQNLGDGRFLDKYKIYTSEKKADKLLACNIYPGELILSKMGVPVARACMIPNTESRFLMASDGIRLVPDSLKFDSQFVLIYINYWIFRCLAIRHSTGSTRQRIGLSDLKKLPFINPPLQEQQKIAKILTTWDKAITQTEQLIAKKQEQKKGLMQQLLTGKKRFKEFVVSSKMKETKLGLIPEDWEVRKLGDIGKVKMCKRVFNQETSNTGDIPFYKIGTFGKEADAFISKEHYIKYRERFSFPNKGDILISAAGTLGRTVVYDGSPSYFQDSNIVWIDNNELLITNKYLYFVYQTIKYESEGGTIQRLYNSIIKSAKFLLPSLPEQQKNASVLSKADKEISSLQNKLGKLKEQKKGLMQKLLTGEVRVKDR